MTFQPFLAGLQVLLLLSCSYAMPRYMQVIVRAIPYFNPWSLVSQDAAVVIHLRGPCGLQLTVTLATTSKYVTRQTSASRLGASNHTQQATRSNTEPPTFSYSSKYPHALPPSTALRQEPPQA